MTPSDPPRDGPRDSLTPAEALTFLNLQDRSRMAILRTMEPEERESILLSLVRAIRQIPAKDRREILAGAKPLTARQLAEFEKAPEKVAA